MRKRFLCPFSSQGCSSCGSALVNSETPPGVRVSPRSRLTNGKSLFLTTMSPLGFACEGHAAEALVLPLETSVPFHDA